MANQMLSKQKVARFDRHSGTPHPRLNVLRSRGQYRARQLMYTDFKGDTRYPNRYYGYRSTAYSELYMALLDKPKVSFVDAGCGDSPDRLIAKLDGFKSAIGIDLFKPWCCPQVASKIKSHRVRFLRGDICDMPLAPNSVDAMSCNAVLDLLTDEDRLLFYSEAMRVLKPGGLLSLSIVNLSCGYGIDTLTERDKCTMRGWGVLFQLERNFPGGFILRKAIHEKSITK